MTSLAGKPSEARRLKLEADATILGAEAVTASYDGQSRIDTFMGEVGSWTNETFGRTICRSHITTSHSTQSQQIRIKSPRQRSSSSTMPSPMQRFQLEVHEMPVQAKLIQSTYDLPANLLDELLILAHTSPKQLTPCCSMSSMIRKRTESILR